MKKILAILCVLMVITSCKAGSSTSAKGNRKITSVEKSISNYSKISLAGSYDMVYEQKAGSPYLRIEIDENLQQYVKAEVKNGSLKVSLEGRNIQPSKFRVYTNSSSLSDLNIGGSGSITLQNQVKSPSLNIAIGGSGSLSAAKIQCDDLNIVIAGSGSAKIEGNATESNIVINGSGSVNASNLITKETNCVINGSGSTKVYASDELSGVINGSGGIKYKGSPKKLNKEVRGSGSISSF